MAQTSSKVKAADETRQSTTTLSNDADLFFNIGANETWAFDMLLLHLTGATPDFKLGFLGPSGCSGYWQNDVSSSAAITDFSTPGVVIYTNNNGTQVRFVNYRGVVINGATPGTVQLQWAQNTSDASNTTVKAGSWLVAGRLL